jgi:hypothetical protein
MLSNASDPMLLKQGTMWKALIRDRLTVSFLRWNKPNLAPVDVTTPDYLIVGGWHHGGANVPTISKFFGRKASTTIKPTIVVEALSSHFPGGKPTAGDRVPPAQIWKNPVLFQNEENPPDCVYSTSRRGDPDINTDLITLVQNEPAMTLSSGEQVVAKWSHNGESHKGTVQRNEP